MSSRPSAKPSKPRGNWRPPESFRFLDLAEEEFEEAKDWYARRAASLPDRLTEQLEACLAAVERSPTSFPNHPRVPDPAVRFATFRSLPYFVLYRVDPDETVVLAVPHVRRGDDYLADAAARG